MSYFLEFIFGALGARLGYLWAQAFKRSRLGTDEVFCGIRVMSGEQPGLSVKWAHARARISPARIDFGKNRKVSVEVRAIRIDHQRVPRGRELWNVSADCQIVPIVTDTAVLELALSPHDSERAIGRLKPPTT